jgi:chemotaxis protein MotB
MTEPPTAPSAQKSAEPSPTAPKTHPPSPAARSKLAWILVVASAVGLVALALSAYKLYERVSGLERELSAARAASAKLTLERDSAREHVGLLEREKQRLNGELRNTTVQQTITQTELERMRAEITAKLGSEIKKGEIVIRKRGGDMVVDVSDKILFDTGSAEINQRGREVLKQVSSSVIGVQKRVFQVSGHTDAARVVSADVRERFPTNWELSTARATNVVRFLQEKCGIPGRRLVAAGYAEHLPIAQNTTAEGKQRNRRIEIALLREVVAD